MENFDKILVAVDFSTGSLHALDLAVDIANKMKSDLTIVWVDNKSEKDTLVLSTQPKNEAMNQETKSLMEKLAGDYKSKLLFGKLDYKIRKGKVYSEIAEEAKQIEANLIVAGTHGESGFEKLWMGSNAFKIVTYAPCPVITVRQDFNFQKKLERIILPIDSSIDTRQKVASAKIFAKIFDAEVHIIALYTTTLVSIRRRVDNYVESVKKVLEEEHVKCVVAQVPAKNVTEDTIKYAEKAQADLIIIMTEQERTAANWLLGPYAQQMVHNSPLPVLSIQPKEIYKVSV